MSALPRPDVTGPVRVLNDALHDLHHRAGWPSLRALAKETGVSHTTVSKAFSRPALPTWGTLELLVEAMHGSVPDFHQLWLAASAPTNGTGPAPRIAGRRAELDVVRRHLESGTGLLLVTGEAGIGKSTLLGAAVASSRCVVAVGRCRPLSAAEPLMPITDALRDLLLSDDGQVVRAAIASCPEFVAQELPRILPELGGHPTRSQVDDFGRQRLFASVDRLLAALEHRSRTVLAIEDLHWADPGTLDLIEHLCAVQSPRGSPRDRVAVLGTWRSGDPATHEANDGWLRRMRRAPNVTTLDLQALSRDETADQLAGLGRGDLLDDVFVRTRGHPLFTAQLAAHLPEDGLPNVLIDLLDARLRDVEDVDWPVARALGVADRPLPVPVLVSVTGLTAEDVRTGLRSLTDRRLLSTTPDAANVMLSHPLLAEAARRRLVPGEAADVHAGLARSLSALPRPVPAEIATHWQRAGDADEEIGWRVLAARECAAKFDWAQEAEHWLRVMELWPDDTATISQPPVTRTSACVAAIDALDESRQWRRAAELSARSETMLPGLGEADRAEVLRRASEYRCDTDGMDVGLQLVDDALEIYGRLPPSAGLLRALSHKRWILMSLGRYDESYALAQRAAEAAADVGDPRAARDAVSTFAWHEGVAGRLERAHELLARGRAMVADGSDPLGDVRHAVLLTDMLLVCGGDRDVIESVGLAGVETAETWRMDNHLSLIVRANVASARIKAGDIRSAAELLGIPCDAPPEPDRWPLHTIRAQLDTLEGDPAHGVERIEAVWSEILADGEVDLESETILAGIHFWNRTSGAKLDQLLKALETVVDSAPARILAPAVLAGARAAADTVPSQAPNSLEATHDLVVRARLTEAGDSFLTTHARAAAAELDRGTGRDDIGQWSGVAVGWDRASRPHDAAYARWRAAQCALRDGQGTVAARLLRKATTDAREHVPLSEAIAATARSGR